MPPKIIYKQRHRDPYRKGRPYTTTANAEHLKYIGTREGVLPTDETARLYLRSDKPSRHYQAEIVLNQLIKQATGEQKSYFESVLGAAYYYSDTLRDTAKAKGLLERAAQNGSEYAAVLLSRIAGHERNAVDSLLCSLMALLNSAEHYSNLDLQNASKLLFGRGDLSKEMIAELIYKRQDKENTSQR